jgi:uncharacterized membrane protein (DUF4010 family)
VTISALRLVPSPLSAHQAALAILAAVASNTLSKAMIGAAIGRRRFADLIAGMAALCITAGGAGLWLGLTFATVA